MRLSRALALLTRIPGLCGAVLLLAGCTGLPLAPVPSDNDSSVSGAWHDRSLSAAQRARSLLGAMTLEEKQQLVMGFTDPVMLLLKGVGQVDAALMADVAKHQVPGSAGYVPGIPRLGVPAQSQTDASIGVRVYGLPRTALPSSLATAASFDPTVTQAAGAMIAQEARQTGFNVFLAGGANLAREPRNGRNFEYAGEDPFLAGVMVSGLIKGIQSQHMVSTMKHFALNDQETDRVGMNVQISSQAMHQSDLLAFEFILDWAHPGSVMCAYNRVNGEWACENDTLLNRILKDEWAYTGYVMSDWGAVHSVARAANHGLDQMTGFPCCGDGVPYFGKPLRDALHAGTVSYARLDDMVFRILLPLFETGTYDDPPVPGAIAVDANAQVAQRAAEQSLVLLKNERQVLPLQSGQRIAVIGGHADKGVLSGGGSSGVTPWGGNAVSGVLPVEWPGPVVYLPSSPLQALRRALSGSTVWYDAGEQTDQAVALAAKADVAVVFVTQWMTEGFDGSLHLDGSQNQLVDAVAKANPRTVVVVESGGAILMPWADQVAGIIEAFYPGSRGGEALAAVLTGRVNPSGHLPISFPATDDQQVRPHPDLTPHDGVPSSVSYDEGAAVGYKWFDLSGIKPRFAFGHGLSYTRFEYTDLEAHAVGDSVRVSMTVRNAGDRAGEALAQVYLAAPATAGWESVKRLANFAKVSLTPGESRRISLSVDRRLLAIYNESRHEWIISPGHYRVMGGAASDDLPLQGDVELLGTVFSAQHATRQ